MSRRLIKQIISLIAIILGLWLLLELCVRVFVEIQWFREVKYFSVLITRWQTQLSLWIAISGFSSFFFLGNLWLAHRWRWRWFDKEQWYDVGEPYLHPHHPQLSASRIESKRISSQVAAESPYPIKQAYSPKIKLPLFLSLVIFSAIAIAGLSLYYSQLVTANWQLTPQLSKIIPVIKLGMNLPASNDLQPELLIYIPQIIVVIIISAAVIFRPLIGLNLIVVYLSIIFSLLITGNWALVLRFLHPTQFNFADPQFQQDISFYIFTLPLWQLLKSWLLGLFITSLLTCFLYYLLSGNSLFEGRFPGFSRLQLRHLSILTALVMLLLGLHHWLNRYELLYSSTGIVYGAGFTDIQVKLRIETILCIISILTSCWLLIRGFINQIKPKTIRQKRAKIFFLILPIATYLSVVLLGILGNQTIQAVLVQPNELAKEKPYIQHSISMTREAFGLNEIEAQTFNPQGKLTSQDLEKNDLTIENIRLWDTRPILLTNRQLQQIRPYYKFPDADIDRYSFQQENLTSDTTNKKQQVIIAARELDYSTVPELAKTWINKHLVYTHGYGFTLSPVNQVDQGGLPSYFVKDIGTGTEEEGNLTVSSDVIRQSIPIGKPRIYYGEMTKNYVLTGTKVRELDFPSGEENVYNTYDGKGGINIRNYLQQLIFAEYLKDWQMVFAQNFTPQTKLLFRRDIVTRVTTIAPFLHYDRDPYLVVADTEQQDDQSHLYWIIDAYTTSDRYPYSDPGEHNFNYLRNSVKVVVDAYNGDINFYIADVNEPIIQTWQKVFPDLLQPLSAMPRNLRRHIRYPEDLFSIQSERLLTYHMTDPQVFYNREDQWQIPQEIYGTESQRVKPYYLIMKLPTAKEEEFILLHPYTPTSRPNLIAWLAARSDGQEYGKLLLYKFPKQKLIYGPNQIEALINQDPVISQQISLWNREGSRAIQGNLLIIPIEQSLLYVEPLYIEAERNSLPTLARVIVIYENKIVMAETLEQGLNAIFQSENNAESPIIRPVEDIPPVLPEEDILPLLPEENIPNENL